MQLSNKNLISYSLLAFTLAFIGLPIYIYLPNYYAQNFALDLKTIAVILFFTRFIDTIQDPVFGIISDRFAHLKRKIILYSSPLLGISFLLLFYPLDIINIKWWIVIFLVSTYSIFSLIYINYQSYAVQLSNDYNIKTKIIAFREVFFISGIIFAAGVPAILFNIFGEVISFLIIGLFYFFIIISFALIFYFFAPKYDDFTNKEATIKLSKLFKNKKLQKFFTIFLLNNISAAIPAVLIMFFVEEVLNLKNLTGIFLIIYFVGLFFGTLFWTKLSQKLNSKSKTWMYAMIMTCLAFVWCYFLEQGDIIFYGLICIFAGFGFGADFCLGYSILTDIIQKDRLERGETTIFGIANFIIKIALTIASSVLIYSIGFFEEYNPIAKIEFIKVSYAILPVLFRIASVFLLYRYFIEQYLAKK